MVDTTTAEACIVLHEGIVAAYRPIDDLLIQNIHAPNLLGINLFIDSPHYYFRALTKIRYELIPLNKVKEIINQNNLWEHVAMHQMWLCSKLMDYLSYMTGVSTREIIIYCLECLKNEPEEIRNNKTVADYVIEKTLLSRSTVMKMLAIFKREGLVKTHKGLLR